VDFDGKTIASKHNTVAGKYTVKSWDSLVLTLVHFQIGPYLKNADFIVISWQNLTDC